MNFCIINTLCIDITIHIQIITFYFSEEVFHKSDHKGGKTKQFNVAMTFDVNYIVHSINWQVFNVRRSYFFLFLFQTHA